MKKLMSVGMALFLLLIFSAHGVCEKDATISFYEGDFLVVLYPGGKKVFVKKPPLQVRPELAEIIYTDKMALDVKVFEKYFLMSFCPPSVFEKTTYVKLSFNKELEDWEQKPGKAPLAEYSQKPTRALWAVFWLLVFITFAFCYKNHAFCVALLLGCTYLNIYLSFSALDYFSSDLSILRTISVVTFVSVNLLVAAGAWFLNFKEINRTFLAVTMPLVPFFVFTPSMMMGRRELTFDTAVFVLAIFLIGFALARLIEKIVGKKVPSLTADVS